MSGVQAGTRLERLTALWRRTRHEIQIAQHAGRHDEVTKLRALETRLVVEIRTEGGVTPSAPGVRRRRGPRRKAEDRVSKHLAQLGVTSHEVKVWAVGQGILPAVKRGRIKGELVAAYQAAHEGSEGAA